MASQAYFVDPDGTGDFYNAIATTAPGESPATNPEKWLKLSIPEVIHQPIVLRAASILLREQGQHDKSRALSRDAEEQLLRCAIRQADRGDFPRPRVLTR